MLGGLAQLTPPRFCSLAQILDFWILARIWDCGARLKPGPRSILGELILLMTAMQDSVIGRPADSVSADGEIFFSIGMYVCMYFISMQEDDAKAVVEIRV